jgi:predicted nucleic acid-binding protein
VICVADTSSFVAFLAGLNGKDVDQLELALSARQLLVPPSVISELLSDPKLSEDHKDLFSSLPQVELLAGYWTRVGLSRSKLIKRGLKARLADALVAQACIDHNFPLIARDRDFRHFQKHCGLELL